MLFFSVLLLSFFISSSSSNDPIELTDQTWKQMLNGHWMVEFYAPWCPACQNFQSTWKDFSKFITKKNVQVAAINVDQYQSLTGRFRIKALPTIYHVHDGVFRQYSSDRSFSSLKNFIENEEWKSIEPVSGFFAPDGILISLMSFLFDIAMIFKDAYNYLENQYQWPAWLIYSVLAVGVALIGICFGVVMVALAENVLGLFFGRKSAKEEITTKPEESNEEQPEKDESDKTLRQRRVR